MAEDLIPLPVRLPPEMYLALRRHALDEDVSMAEVIREALLVYLPGLADVTGGDPPAVGSAP